jgi:hypothetical protein
VGTISELYNLEEDSTSMGDLNGGDSYVVYSNGGDSNGGDSTAGDSNAGEPTREIPTREIPTRDMRTSEIPIGIDFPCGSFPAV